MALLLPRIRALADFAHEATRTWGRPTVPAPIEHCFRWEYLRGGFHEGGHTPTLFLSLTRICTADHDNYANRTQIPYLVCGSGSMGRPRRPHDVLEGTIAPRMSPSMHSTAGMDIPNGDSVKVRLLQRRDFGFPAIDSG